MKSNKKCVVHGSYYGNNFGDTLLIKLMCDYMASLLGKENVYLAVKGLETEQDTLGYPVVPDEYVKDIDYIILGGGGYYGEPNTTNWRRFKWIYRNYNRHILWLKKFSNAKIGTFGIGFGPLSNPLHRRSVVKLFNSFEYAVFRDNESFNYAKEYGVKTDKIVTDIGVDFALSLEESAHKTNQVIFHLHNLSPSLIRQVIETVASSETYSNDKFRYVVLYDNPNQVNLKSQDFYTEIFNDLRINNVSFEFYKNYTRTVKVISDSDLIVTNKLHVGIVGIASGSKVISIPSHQKTIRLYRQLNIESFCIPVGVFKITSLKKAIEQTKLWYVDRSIINNGVDKLKYNIKRFIKEEV